MQNVHYDGIILQWGSKTRTSLNPKEREVITLARVNTTFVESYYGSALVGRVCGYIRTGGIRTNRISIDCARRREWHSLQKRPRFSVSSRTPALPHGLEKIRWQRLSIIFRFFHKLNYCDVSNQYRCSL